MKRGMILMITVSRRACPWRVLLWKKQLMVGKHENERELLVEHSLGRNLIDDPQKTFPGISVLFSFEMFVSGRKRSAENKIRRCVVSPLPRSLFIADHQIYHSFSFWWQSKQIYHLCHQNPICLNSLSLEGFTESVERFQFTEWRSIGYILGYSRSPNSLGDFSKSTSLELILPSWFNI